MNADRNECLERKRGREEERKRGRENKKKRIRILDLGHIENNNAFAQSNVRSFPLLCFLASVEASSGMREVKRLNAVVISVPYSFI